MKKLVSVLMSLFMSFVLSACGGGGEKVGTSSSKPPTNNETNQKKDDLASNNSLKTFIIDKTIFVRFDKPIENNSKNKLILRDKNGNKLSHVRANLINKNKLLTVTSDAMKPNSSYTLTMNFKGIKNRELTYKTKIRLVKTGQSMSYGNFDDGHYKIGKPRDFKRIGDVVTDNVTTLQWQDDSNVSLLRLSQNEAKEYCANKGDGWRLPNIEELRTILDYSVQNKTIDPTFEHIGEAGFKRYWTSSNNLQMKDFGVFINFSHGTDDSSHKNNKYYVRCVKGDRFVKTKAEKNGDIVLDLDTGLTWRDKISVNKLTWSDALKYCNDLGDNWRLPNIKELLSIASQEQETKPSLKQGFIYRSSGQFWSSTTLASDTSVAYGVDFYVGGDFIHENKNDEKNLARCVRGYETEDLIQDQNTTQDPPISNATYTPKHPTEIDEVTLDASGSIDGEEGNNLEYEWLDGNTSLGNVKIYKGTFSAGEHNITLKVTDISTQKTDSKNFELNVQETNPPKAEAKANPQNALEEKEITLDASGSKDVKGGNKLLYKWYYENQVLSQKKIFKSTFPEGDHNVTLKVIDKYTNKASTDTVHIHINKNPALQPPTAEASYSPQNPMEFYEVTLDATGSHDWKNGEDIEYEWFDEYDVKIGSQKIIKKIFDIGDRKVTLKVTDKFNGKSKTRSLIIPVALAPYPIADIQVSKHKLEEDEEITFDGRGSTDGTLMGKDLTYEWRNGPNFLSSSEMFKTSFKINNNQNQQQYHISLKVTNTITNKSTTGSVSIIVKKKNKAPVAKITIPLLADEDEEILLDATDSTDEDKNSLKYKWYVNGTFVGDEKVQPYTFSIGSPSPSNIKLIVIDKQGLTDEVEEQITIKPKPNEPPTAVIEFSTAIATEDTYIELNASRSYDDDSIVSYEWRDNDIQFSTNEEVKKKFSVGTHIISLEIVDSDGEMDRKDFTLKIFPKYTPLKPGKFKVFKTGQSTCYKMIGGGGWQKTSCTDPQAQGQDGKLQLGAVREFVRYKDVVTDKITGLQWQDDVKVTAKTVRTICEAKNVCSKLDLQGFKDWRVPTIDEITTLLDYSSDTTTLNPIFKYGKNKKYFAQSIPLRGVINFTDGSLLKPPYIFNVNIRCVRGEMEKTNLPLELKIDGTVYDPNTNLTWTHSIEYEKWIGAKEYCEDLVYANKDNWRLPNINELRTLIDFKKNDLSFKNIFYPYNYRRTWSSTTAPGMTDRAYIEDTGSLRSPKQSKQSTVIAVRCVSGKSK